VSMATWTVHTFHLTAYGIRTVYIGVSCVSPAERFKQHLSGYKSSRQARNGRPESYSTPRAGAVR
jgi:hypothetical protein